MQVNILIYMYMYACMYVHIYIHTHILKNMIFQCFWSTWRYGFCRKRSTNILYLCGTTFLW